MGRNLLFFLRKLIFAALALALACSSAAFAQDDARPQIDQTHAVLVDIDQSLKSDFLDDADLQRLRSENDPLAADMFNLVAKLSPLLQASQKRLDALTPKTAGGDAATPESQTELKAEKAKFDALDANIRSARALIVDANDISARIAERRRALFARQTFAQSQSLLSPTLWSGAAADAPRAFAILSGLLGDWTSHLTLRQIAELCGLLLVMGGVGVPAVYAARNVIARDPSLANPTRLQRALGAVATALVLAVLPLLALGVLSYALDALDISDPRLQGQFDAFFDGLRLIAIANALARALFAPGAEKWRLLRVPDDAANVISRLWVGIAAIVSIEKWFEPAADAVSSLNLVILLRALTAALIAVLVGWAVWRNWRRRNPKAESDLAAYLRLAGAAAAAGLLACALLGFVALATFAVTQGLFIAGLAATLYLFDALVQAAGDRFVSREASSGRAGSGAGRSGAERGAGARRFAAAHLLHRPHPFAGSVGLSFAGCAGLAARSLFGHLHWRDGRFV